MTDKVLTISGLRGFRDEVAEQIARLLANIEASKATLRVAMRRKRIFEDAIGEATQITKSSFVAASRPRATATPAADIVRQRAWNPGSVGGAITSALSSGEVFTETSLIAAAGVALSKSDGELRPKVKSALQSLMSKGLAEKVDVDGEALWALSQPAPAK